MSKERPFSESELEHTAERTLSDAGAIRGGAKYVEGEAGSRLEVTKDQIANADQERRYAVFKTNPKEWSEETRSAFWVEIDRTIIELNEKEKKAKRSELNLGPSAQLRLWEKLEEMLGPNYESTDEFLQATTKLREVK